MASSSALLVKDFDFLLVEKDAENIREIMQFCGVADADIEQELIFHNEGDPFMVSNEMDVYRAEGQYLVKENTDVFVISANIFNLLLVPDVQGQKPDNGS